MPWLSTRHVQDLPTTIQLTYLISTESSNTLSTSSSFLLKKTGTNSSSWQHHLTTNKKVVHYFVKIPWTKLNSSVDYVNNVCNEIKHNAQGVETLLKFYKNNWLHADLFSKHFNKRIGFGFLNNHNIFKIPQWIIKFPLPIFIHADPLPNLPITSYHSLLT